MMDRLSFVQRVAWWGLVSSAAAPVLLIGGWTLAAARQPASFSSVRDTISALAAHGANDRQIMTAALVGLGASHVITSVSLRGVAGAPGRAVLMIGGLATVAVAAFPLPVTGGSGAHTLAAATAFGCLAVWPFLSSTTPPTSRAVSAVPWGVRRRTAVAAGAGLSALVAAFYLSLLGGNAVGISERVAAGAQALWPLAVVLSARRLGSKTSRLGSKTGR